MPDRTAMITGASRGIGKACAEILAVEGYRLLLVARGMEKLQEVARALKTATHCVAVDLADTEAIAPAAAQAMKDFGPVDILVNNAGVTKDGLAVRMKKPDWDHVLQTNLTAPFALIQQVLPHMMRERWGRIVNISSLVGTSGNAGQANYSSSKAALIGLTKSLAQEVGSRNITVNAVAPGYIETDMTGVLSKELMEKAVERTPLKRIGTPNDIAYAVKYLIGEEASFVTGHVLHVNGGIYM